MSSNTQKIKTVKAVTETPATEKINSADVTTSFCNPVKDGFITVTKKECDDTKAVKSSENNKIGENLYLCVRSTKFLVPSYYFQNDQN